MPSFFLIQGILCKHIPQNIALNINLKYILRKELAKIKLRNIEQVSKVHLQLEIRKLQMSLDPKL